MRLYRNGYIVATVNDYDNFSYNSWPLTKIKDDEVVDGLIDEADDKWFTVFDMQEVAPDLDYAIRYADYCKELGIEAVILLAETSDSDFEVNDDICIEEVYGFDCIGTVYFSYLRAEAKDFKEELHLNRYGLFDTIEDVDKYIELRREVIESGVNLEDYWKETPIRLSKVKRN